MKVYKGSSLSSETELELGAIGVPRLLLRGVWKAIFRYFIVNCAKERGCYEIEWPVVLGAWIDA